MSAPSRILFAGGGTGGHLYPALALGEAFRRRNAANQIFYVGARRGVEARVLPERGVPHELLPLEPIRRERPWQNWRLLPALWGSGAGLSRIFRDFRPDLVVGTGGYASGPAVAWALLNGVPAAVQEQNSFPGLVTRWVAGRVRQIHLAFPEARRYLRPGATTEVFEHGNPIQPPDPAIDRDAARANFGLGGGPVALVVGGSQGARRVNAALLDDLEAVHKGQLPQRADGLELLWATGPAHFEEVQTRLAPLGLPWVRPIPYIERMSDALAAADLAVSRAGAMALAELCAWGIPSILVPFPHAAANHQYHNAQALDAAGAGVMIEEDALGGGRLWTELVQLAASAESRARIAANARTRGRPDAADQIVADLYKLLER